MTDLQDLVRRIIQEELLKHHAEGTALAMPTASDAGSGGGGDSSGGSGGGGDAGGAGADYSGDAGGAGADYSGDAGGAGADYSGDAGGAGADYSGDAGGGSSGPGGQDVGTSGFGGSTDFGAPDSGGPSPSFLYIKPDGTTYGVFSGGVVLPEASGSPFNVQDAVQWTSDGTPTGITREYIQGGLNLGAHYLALKSNPDILNAASLTLNSVVTGGAGSASVAVFAQDSSGGSPNKILIDSLSQASFPQLPSSLRTQVLFGSITSQAGVNGTPSGGFTVVRNSIGNYTITWGQAFKDNGYGFGILSAAGPNIQLNISSQLAGSLTIVSHNQSTGALADAGFTFVACGVW